MNWLPQNTLLGELTIDEVFTFFDGPRVFSCKSITDQRYLVGWAEENSENSFWLYLPISDLRFKMVRSGRWQLKTAYLQPESRIYGAILHHDLSIPDKIIDLTFSDIKDEWLPADGFRLQAQTATHKAAISPEELQLKAIQEGRTRLRIEIDSDDRLRSEASTRKIAALLTATQNVIDNFGNREFASDPSQDGRFSRQVKDKMETDVLELAAASFVIEIGSADGNDLLGDSPVARVMQRLVGLMSVQTDPEYLWQTLSDLKPRAAKSFRSFVTELANLDSNITIATANTERKYRSESLTSDQILNLKLLLKQIVPDEIKELRGRMNLFLGNSERRAFGFRDLYDNQAIEGRVGESAMSQFEHATLGNVYDVVISSYASFDKGVGVIKEKFVLEQLTLASDQTPLALSIVTLTEANGPIIFED